MASEGVYEAGLGLNQPLCAAYAGDKVLELFFTRNSIWSALLPKEAERGGSVLRQTELEVCPLTEQGGAVNVKGTTAAHFSPNPFRAHTITVCAPRQEVLRCD